MCQQCYIICYHEVNKVDVGFRLIRLLAPKYDASVCLIVLDLILKYIGDTGGR
jgi:hypothetical protein